ncbi:hypothetical protein [Methylobacterium soli]|uniref:hypothetical protein n=1 Tax=Methylobacterium soli TaxID=553447 RepID=UPI001EE2148A|nr:hypothetical protein [Methylobacterium soli]GJE44134.1 hypothetical protein AEGHOMDF_3320 [Methylobacterium soli]
MTGRTGPIRGLTTTLSALAGLSQACLPALAQIAVTGTGGGPHTTITAPHTSPVGQTVPPGAAAAPVVDPDARTDRQRRLDGVLGGICTGCRPDG